MRASPDLPDRDRLRIAALVVTHNRQEKLRVTIARLLAEDLDHVLVFDNASTDGTGDYLESVDDPRFVVMRSPENLGGAGGFAHGLRQLVQHHDPDWIVVMDDDGRPFPGTMARFRALDLGGWDALGAAVLTPSGQVCEMNRPYRNPFWRLPEFLRTLVGGGRGGFYIDDRTYDAGSDPVEIDMSSFVGLFLSRACFARAGYPDERLFIYGDDQLYTLEMRRKGLRIGFLPELRFEHDTGAVHTGGHMVLRPLWKVYYIHRNTLLAYRVAAGPWFWPLLPLLALKWHRRARHYGPDAARYRRIMRRAFRDGLRRRLGLSHAEIVALAERRD
ncbi:Glycosyltransferase, GT2 family [Paracoccus aminovorans]|uniref:Glycosyltransferase, GT2 family n=1 Tax=Paracoccus aminovorans TaxID=34004 RepID=A0A1I2Z4S3_9RHOB|nr:glycosyltransferase [Paracoccus aminovorans]CQR83983.1 glycosyl transferase [Paracoccus aminovorans]SFH32867.1 Glycosyltransferase, GT2 family [Paracoccus aminovorans]